MKSNYHYSYQDEKREAILQEEALLIINRNPGNYHIWKRIIKRLIKCL